MDIESYDITFTLHLLNYFFLEKITLIYEMLILHLLFFYISLKIKYVYIFQSFVWKSNTQQHSTKSVQASYI